MFLLSLPMRERGLKYNGGRGQLSKPLSLPMRGAWIEICSMAHGKKYLLVAPHAGAWIEIRRCMFGIRLPYCCSPCGGVD